MGEDEDNHMEGLGSLKVWGNADEVDFVPK